MAPRDGRCRSDSQFGRCGLKSNHFGDHAVPISDGLWYGFKRNSLEGVGYGRPGRRGWIFDTALEAIQPPKAP